MLMSCSRTSVDQYLMFEESIYDSNHLAVSEGDTQVKRVIIPSEYNGKTVDLINPSAFKNNEVIEYVYIPSTVTNIGIESFMNCTNLKEVIFEDGSTVTEISASAFENTNLNSVFIPDSVLTINANAFAYSSLLSITFNESSNLEVIRTGAFRNTKIESITIPGKVIAIHYGAFAYTKLDSVTFLEGENELFILGAAFSYIETLREITLPSRVTLNDGGVFSGCHDLTIYINECDGINDWSDQFHRLEYGIYAEVINNCPVE